MEAWRPKGLSRFDARTGFAVPEGGNAWIVWDGGSKVLKTEPNIQAGKPVRQAMGIPVSWRGHNWTVCDIWGFDDPAFQQSNLIVRDPRYYSCVGNMVLLPTPLKALTDSVPEVKHMLRVCAFDLYGWMPVIRDAPGLVEQVERVRSGEVFSDPLNFLCRSRSAWRTRLRNDARIPRYQLSKSQL